MNSGWEPPPGEIMLLPDHVDIWRIRLDPATLETARLYGLLSVQERGRAARFTSKLRRNQFIAGRGMLRLLMGRYLDSDPAGFEFACSEHQKPYLPRSAAGAPVTFNITHSHEQLLIALALERDIGIDIELIRHDVEFIKLARRFFSRRECALLESCDDSGLAAAFFSCWTRKEAFVKALGEGISFGLADFSVSVGAQDRRVALQIERDVPGSDTWSIINLDAGGHYAAAVAANGGDFTPRLWRSDLLSSPGPRSSIPPGAENHRR